MKDFIEFNEPQKSTLMPDKWIVSSKEEINEWYHFLAPNGHVGIPYTMSDFFDYYFDTELEAQQALGLYCHSHQVWYEVIPKQDITSEPLFE